MVGKIPVALAGLTFVIAAAVSSGAAGSARSEGLAAAARRPNRAPGADGDGDGDGDGMKVHPSAFEPQA